MALIRHERSYVNQTRCFKVRCHKRKPSFVQQFGPRPQFLPDGHFVLARALVAQNKWKDAREVMSATMALQPGNKAAVEYHRRLGEE
jgi:hypothetical protein